MLSVSEKQVEELTDLVERVRERSKTPHTEDWKPYLYSLESAVLKLQVGPFQPLAKKTEALAQELGGALGKQVHCECSGFHFESQEVLRDALSVILLHAVRNAVDHGIELPFQRLAQGKSPAGKIKVEAFLEGAVLKLLISDDGSGVDLDAVVARAIELNLVSRLEAEKMSAKEKLYLLLKSPLSTRKEATEISGRGVGLSTILSTLVGLKGQIVLTQNKNEGLKIQITIPLKMVRLEASLVRFGEDLLWFPVESFEVLESYDIQGKITHPLVEVLGWKLGKKSRYFSLVGKLQIPEVIAANEIGKPEFQFFRKCDPIWENLGPPWLRFWLKKSKLGALACKMDEGHGLGLLADLSTIQKIVES